VLIAEAISAGWKIEEQFVAPGGLAVLGTDARSFDLENGVMERVASTSTPQPVIAIAERRTSSLSQLRLADWVVVADQISDPGNLGTILRSAESAGVSAVVLTPGTVEVFNSKVVRSSAGAMFHVPIIEDVTIEEVRDNGFRTFGTSSHKQAGSVDFASADLRGKIALVVGNEAHGIDENTDVDSWLTIPHRGRSESLNVAMACTLVCFEAARQRNSS
jgi:TrmH family RNA methyltransferase